MILKFFKTDGKKKVNSELIDVACLMIHAAKIDENYTDHEKNIIKNTILKLDKTNADINKLLIEAETKESDTNHIQEFTKKIQEKGTEVVVL